MPTINEETITMEPKKRGRGRPRKYPRPDDEVAAGGGGAVVAAAATNDGTIHNNTNNNGDDAVVVVVKKRGRGRPRKYPRPEAVSGGAADGGAAVPKKRGRPRKQPHPEGTVDGSVTTTTTTTTTTKIGSGQGVAKKRGRPRKQPQLEAGGGPTTTATTSKNSRGKGAAKKRGRPRKRSRPAKEEVKVGEGAVDDATNAEGGGGGGRSYAAIDIDYYGTTTLGDGAVAVPQHQQQQEPQQQQQPLHIPYLGHDIPKQRYPAGTVLSKIFHDPTCGGTSEGRPFDGIIQSFDFCKDSQRWMYLVYYPEDGDREHMTPKQATYHVNEWKKRNKTKNDNNSNNNDDLAVVDYNDDNGGVVEDSALSATTFTSNNNDPYALPVSQGDNIFALTYSQNNDNDNNHENDIFLGSIQQHVLLESPLSSSPPQPPVSVGKTVAAAKAITAGTLSPSSSSSSSEASHVLGAL